MSKGAHSHSTPSSTVERGGIRVNPLHTTVEEGTVGGCKFTCILTPPLLYREVGFESTPLHTTVEEGRRMRIHSHPTRSSDVERGELNPPLHYSRGGCDVGVSSHPTHPSIIDGGMQASPSSMESRGSCEVGVGLHHTHPSTIEGGMRGAPSSTVKQSRV